MAKNMMYDAGSRNSRMIMVLHLESKAVLHFLCKSRFIIAQRCAPYGLVANWQAPARLRPVPPPPQLCSTSDCAATRGGGLAESSFGRAAARPGKRLRPDTREHSALGAEGGMGGPSKRCQVPGCAVDLEQLEKPYHLKKRLCPAHLKAEAVQRRGHGDQLWRFCQQCGKLEPLARFEGTKRSCVVGLEKRRVTSSRDKQQKPQRLELHQRRASSAACSSSPSLSAATAAGKPSGMATAAPAPGAAAADTTAVADAATAAAAAARAAAAEAAEVAAAAAAAAHHESAWRSLAIDMLRPWQPTGPTAADAWLAAAEPGYSAAPVAAAAAAATATPLQEEVQQQQQQQQQSNADAADVADMELGLLIEQALRQAAGMSSLAADGTNVSASPSASVSRPLLPRMPASAVPPRPAAGAWTALLQEEPADRSVQQPNAPAEPPAASRRCGRASGSAAGVSRAQELMQQYAQLQAAADGIKELLGTLTELQAQLQPALNRAGAGQLQL